MIAPYVIILTSGQVRADSGRELSDLIATVLRLKKKPVVVLGPDADELLRNCNEIENCEIVFDPNFEGGFFSGLKAGLFALNQGGAFVVSLGAPHLNAKDWSKLESALLNSEQEHVIRAATRNKTAEVNFPLLVTARGISHLKNLPAQLAWPPEREVIFREVSLDEANAALSTSL